VRRVAALLAFVLALAAWSVAFAGELVMFETADCPWCRLWHRQIGPGYLRSDIARELPLRRIDLRAERPADLRGVENVEVTPTFVVREGGREIGRIIGYSGEHMFWGMIEQLRAQARVARGS
jgi:thioredoxin-related protein